LILNFGEKRQYISRAFWATSATKKRLLGLKAQRVNRSSVEKLLGVLFKAIAQFGKISAHRKHFGSRGVRETFNTVKPDVNRRKAFINCGEAFIHPVANIIYAFKQGIECGFGDIFAHARIIRLCGSRLQIHLLGQGKSKSFSLESKPNY